MKFLIFLICIFVSIGADAQIIYGIYPLDSFTVKLSDSSSIIPDTSSHPLWQIGYKHKSFFASDSLPAKGIMTDTTTPYPTYANNSFILKKFPYSDNGIVSIYHRYNIDINHAGGMVEYSLDNGYTWQNIDDSCNVGSFFYFGIHTENFYSKNDTLFSGETGFKGSSNGNMISKFQFFCFEAVRLSHKTTFDCNVCRYGYRFQPLIRFKFVSDFFPYTDAGWMIDSISIRKDYYGGSVQQLNEKQLLQIFPNPSFTGSFNFPSLINEEHYTLFIYNLFGNCILKIPYCHQVDLNYNAKGLYFYKVTDGVEIYNGKLSLE